MPSTSLDLDPAIPEGPTAGGSLAGQPWSFRLAGARSVSPALELYESGVLLDVVSSTPIAPQLVRGARAAAEPGCQRVIAWGRLPVAGAGLEVEFSSGTIRRRAVLAAVIEVTPWCWIAIADGRFDRVVARSGGHCRQHRLAGGRRWR